MHGAKVGLWAACAVAWAHVGCSSPGAAQELSAIQGSAAPSAQAPDRAGQMWGASYFPNVELTTHEGKKVRFFDDLVKDKVVAINFIYTTCPDACPMETARLVEVQKLLGDRLGKDIFFYSISIDPGHDTPEVLKAYAEQWHTAPGWTFLTGKEEDVILLRKKLGVFDADTKRTDHNVSMVIGNQKSGRWMKRSPYENPYVLANQLGSWLSNWKTPSKGDRDYADAPPVRNISAGEELFRARCAACHTVGGGDRDDFAEHRVGPDLFEVGKRRERPWLERWLIEPDAMLAEKDPIATKLFADYKQIVMPNLRLTRSDVENVLGYVEEESASVAFRAEAERASAPAGAASSAPSRVEAAPLGPLPDAALPGVKAMLTSYESVRERLAADDLAGAQKSAARVAEEATVAADEAGAAKQGLLELARAAKAMGDGKDLVPVRDAFGELSKRVVTLFVENPALRKGHHLFFCPMARGYKKWVQESAVLRNPYWGKEMLTCGRELERWES